MADEIASLIDRYGGEQWHIPASAVQFGPILGRGASGTTYSGQHGPAKVAIKAYSLSILRNDPTSVKNEMDIMSRISHPNIVTFRGLLLSRTPPSAALVTEFAANGELGDAMYRRQLLRKKGNALRFRVALGLARGLQYLHGNNVIHRDLKPANVLLDGGWEPLLTDFGFSRFMDSGGDMTGETGSYRYMAPEVIKHQAYSHKADVYSFGILLNEVFNDEPPYDNLLPIHAAVGVVKQALRPSQKRSRQKFESLADLAVECWDADPEKRPGWDDIIRRIEDAAVIPETAKRSSRALARTSNPFGRFQLGR